MLSITEDLPGKHLHCFAGKSPKIAREANSMAQKFHEPFLPVRFSGYDRWFDR
jgi:hypothetical protein